MKAWGKTKGKLSRRSAKRLSKHGHIVKALAAQGVNADVIAAHLGINKNRLRAEYALDLHTGRVKLKKQKAAAAVAALSKQDAELLDRIRGSFASHWYTKEFGNDLYGGTHTVEDAFRWCKDFKTQ